MKLITYNIFKKNIPGLQKRLNQFVKESDFVLLQEWISSVKKEPGFTYDENATFKIPLLKKLTGTCTISKHQKLEEEKIQTKHRELYFLTRKSSIVSTYLVDEKEIVIVNIHAINFIGNKAWEKELLQILHSIPKNKATIFAGDFNTWNNIRFNFLEKTLINAGFKYASYDYNMILRLDHIFYKNIEVKKCEALINVHNSDHYPILLEFETL